MLEELERLRPSRPDTPQPRRQCRRGSCRHSLLPQFRSSCLGPDPGPCKVVPGWLQVPGQSLLEVPSDQWGELGVARRCSHSVALCTQRIRKGRQRLLQPWTAWPLKPHRTLSYPPAQQLRATRNYTVRQHEGWGNAGQCTAKL